MIEGLKDILCKIVFESKLYYLWSKGCDWLAKKQNFIIIEGINDKNKRGFE